MKKSTAIVLILIFVFAYFLRVMYLPEKALTFGYDQARDHLRAMEIIGGDFKIQGPPASTPGMHHGVAWFYFLVPPTLVSSGNPIISAYWNALFNAFVVFIVYAITYSMSRKKLAGYFAAFLFAISFEATQYATWLSNPTLGAWTVPLIYLGLWMWISEKDKISVNLMKIAPVITGLGLGLSIQANVFLMYHTVPVILWLWIARKKISKSRFFTFVATGLLTVSPMILTEIKFGFRSISGVLSLLSSQDSIIAAKEFGDFILLFFNQLGRAYSFNSYPGNVGYGGMFVLILLIVALHKWKIDKSKVSKDVIFWQPFLATWLLAHVTVVTVGGASTPFLLVGIGAAVSILIGVSLCGWWESGHKVVTIFVLLILVYGNISMIRTENPNGQTIFAIQKDMLLSRQIEAIDYTYENAGGENFSINTLTSPLWINIVWTYLYEWHGEPAYGYLPTWHGQGQEGQIIALDTSLRTDLYFLILEPLGGIPIRFSTELLTEEGYFSDIVEERIFGKELVVQKRLIK